MQRPQEKEHASRESSNGCPGNRPICVTAGHRMECAVQYITRETTAACAM